MIEIEAKAAKNILVQFEHITQALSKEGEASKAFVMNVTLMHVLYKEVWIIEVCGAAERCAVSLHNNLVPSLPLGLGFVQPSNHPVQETALAPKQRIINIQLNQLPD